MTSTSMHLTTEVHTTGLHDEYTEYLINGHAIGLQHDPAGWWGVTLSCDCYPTAKDALKAMQSHWENVASRYKRSCPAKEHALGQALLYQTVAVLFPEQEVATP